MSLVEKKRINVSLAGDVNSKAGVGVAVGTGHGARRVLSDVDYMGSGSAPVDSSLTATERLKYKGRAATRGDYATHARTSGKKIKRKSRTETQGGKVSYGSSRHTALKSLVQSKLS